MKITRTMTEVITIKIPKLIVTTNGDNDPHVCTLDDRTFGYDCPYIKCSECYFGLSVVKAMAEQE